MKQYSQVKRQYVTDWYIAIDLIQTPIKGFNSSVFVKKYVFHEISNANYLYITTSLINYHLLPFVLISTMPNYL